MLCIHFFCVCAMDVMLALNALRGQISWVFCFSLDVHVHVYVHCTCTVYLGGTGRNF